MLWGRHGDEMGTASLAEHFPHPLFDRIGGEMAVSLGHSRGGVPQTSAITCFGTPSIVSHDAVV